MDATFTPASWGTWSFWDWGLGFRVLGFRVQGSGFRDWDLRIRVQGYIMLKNHMAKTGRGFGTC